MGPVGAWQAFGKAADDVPDSDRSRRVVELREGDEIRLMGEDSVNIPLWMKRHGLLFGSVDEVLESWPVTRELAQALEDWGNAWQAHDGEPEHDAEAARLCRVLRNELWQHDILVRVIYQP